jgi:hypothetical protein
LRGEEEEREWETVDAGLVGTSNSVADPLAADAPAAMLVSAATISKRCMINSLIATCAPISFPVLYGNNSTRKRVYLLGVQVLADGFLEALADPAFGDGCEVAIGEDGVYDLGVGLPDIWGH